MWDWLFPKRCLGCGRTGAYFCARCRKEIVLGQRRGRVLVCLAYRGIVRQGLLQLKFRFVKDLSQELVALTDEYFQNYNHLFAQNSLLVPIPLHPLKKRWRGFNQAELLGRLIAQKQHWGFEPNLLIRSKLAKTQSKLPFQERQCAQKGTFSLNPKNIIPASTPIVLFDDVSTTRATLKEAQKTLCDAGYKKVQLLALGG